MMKDRLRLIWGCLLVTTLSMAAFVQSPAVVAKQSGFAKILASESPATLTRWGRRYEHGERVRENVDRAIRLYCKAAKKGHAPAQYHLGYLYALGRSVARKDSLAVAWFRKAAKQGHPQARNMLKLVRARPNAEPKCLLSDGLPIGAPRRFASRNPDIGPIVELVRTLAPQYRLDPVLVLAVIEAESAFDPNARSHKNAQGLMQLIPATAKRFGVQDVWDPEQNLRGGMAYLRWLLDHFEGDVELALAGYNAGEEAVRRYRGVPPYAETEAYVARISRRLNL